MTNEPGGKSFNFTFLNSRSSRQRQANAEAKRLLVARPKKTQCAMHTVSVTIFDCEEQFVGCSPDSITAFTLLCFNKRFWRFFKEERLVTSFWRSEYPGGVDCAKCSKVV